MRRRIEAPPHRARHSLAKRLQLAYFRPHHHAAVRAAGVDLVSPGRHSVRENRRIQDVPRKKIEFTAEFVA